MKTVGFTDSLFKLIFFCMPFLGNFHKWVYVSRSCAFLYVSPPFRGQIHHVVSSNHVKTPHHRFGYIGTRDYSPFFTLPTAIKFYQDMGGLVSLHACFMFIASASEIRLHYWLYLTCNSQNLPSIHAFNKCYVVLVYFEI